MTFDIALPNKYLTKTNCTIPAGHFLLSCYFVTKEEFNTAIASTNFIPFNSELEFGGSVGAEAGSSGNWRIKILSNGKLAIQNKSGANWLTVEEVTKV